MYKIRQILELIFWIELPAHNFGNVFYILSLRYVLVNVFNKCLFFLISDRKFPMRSTIQFLFKTKDSKYQFIIMYKKRQNLELIFWIKLPVHNFGNAFYILSLTYAF